MFADWSLAEEWSERLGLGVVSRVRRLTAGRSGSTVLALRADGRRLVLKVTTDPRRLERAALEADLLASSALRDVTPELVASDSSSDRVAVVTEECTSWAGVGSLDHPNWLRVAETLGDCHRRGVDAVPRAGPLDPTVSAADLAPWAALGAVDDALVGHERLARSEPSRLPTVLEHGDCHVDNILHDPRGRLVWVDWQDARRGDGVADLVFCWQRAEFSGGHPPRPQMLAAYAVGRGLAAADLQTRVDEVELRLLLQSWPPFLSYGTAGAREVMRRRLAALVRTETKV